MLALTWFQKVFVKQVCSAQWTTEKSPTLLMDLCGHVLRLEFQIHSNSQDIYRISGTMEQVAFNDGASAGQAARTWPIASALNMHGQTTGTFFASPVCGQSVAGLLRRLQKSSTLKGGPVCFCFQAGRRSRDPKMPYSKARAFQTWRRVERYVKQDLREILLPTSMPDPPGYKPPRRLSWTDRFEVCF